MADEHSPIVFLHVPKTGGMSLTSLLRRQFPSDAVLELEGPLAAASEKLASLPGLQRIRCIHGHVAFGLHRALPAARYVTLVRDPIERIVSIYYYARRRPEWGLHLQIAAHRWSLEDFVESDAAAEFHDQQTRMLCGLEAGDGETPSAAEAIAIVDAHFALAGPTERFDELVLLCQRLFGWGDVRYRRENVNRRRPRLDQISPRTRARIEQKNLRDLELHAVVAQKFAERLRELPSLASHLRRLRRRNALYDWRRSLFG